MFKPLDKKIEWNNGSRPCDHWADFTTKNNKNYRLFLETEQVGIRNFLSLVKDKSLIPEDLQQRVLESPHAPVLKITFEDQSLEKTDGEQNEHTSCGITGSGNSVEVFSNVYTMLKDFGEKNRSPFGRMLASEPSRIKLYDKMVKRLTHTASYKCFSFPYADNEKMYVFYF